MSCTKYVVANVNVLFMFKNFCFVVPWMYKLDLYFSIYPLKLNAFRTISPRDQRDAASLKIHYVIMFHHALASLNISPPRHILSRALLRIPPRHHISAKYCLIKNSDQCHKQYCQNVGNS